MSMSANTKTATCRGVEVLSASECRQIVERKLKTKEVEILEVTTKPLGETPAGNLGDHFLVVITASTSDVESKELRVFVKTVPTSAAQNEFAHQTGGHKKEKDFFEVLIHDLLKYNEDPKESEVSVPLAWAVKCHLTTSTKIVLDDLSAKGYKNHGQRSFMDKELCELAVQVLARFHASSLIFEEKETQRTGQVCRLNEVYPEQFVEAVWISEKKHPCHLVCATGVDVSAALIKYLPGMKEDEERHRDLVERMWACFDDMCSFLTAPSKVMRNVVTHGDMWSNNILVKYENEKPVDVKFVDFQLLRYTVPANDFLTFLHLNTRRQMREQHLLDLARTYHDTLRAELTRHHLDVDSILPWDQFEASLAQYKEMAAFIASFYFPFVFMAPGVMSELLLSPEMFQRFMFEDRTPESCRCFQTDPLFKEMLTECLEELTELLARRQM